jgi:5-methyltetrahydrofolate--homocysteine methyltransferase
VRLKYVTEYAATQAAGSQYQVTVTDLGGVLDVLASFLTPKDLILAMRRTPDLIDTCRTIILEKWLHLFDELRAIIREHLDGCGTWLRIWCPKAWYPIQCDFSAMLSPAWFERFALPDIVTQAEHMDYAIYHLDGPNQIPYVDDLLSCPAITGIQCVPGIQGSCRDEKWINVYKKIQLAGKNLVIDVPPADLCFFYEQFDPKGLLVNSIFNSKDQADTFLPDFVGGRGGRDEEGNKIITSPGQFRVL